MCNKKIKNKKNTVECWVSIRTSNIQAIITGKLCKWGHIVGVVGKVMSLLCNALCSLQDTIIAGGLKGAHTKRITCLTRCENICML